MPGANPPSAEVTRVASAATRCVLFKVGQVRFDLATTAITAFSRAHDCEGHDVAAEVLVPQRYRAAAASDAEH